MNLAPLQFDKKRFHGISSRIPSLQTISSSASEGLRTTPIDEMRASMARSGGTDPQHTSAFIAGVASFATQRTFLFRQRRHGWLELVTFHLGGKYRSCPRNQPRLFHDAAG